jgi:hypothetical protein
MWAKVLAGVIAAAAVVGLGVYIANPGPELCTKCHDTPKPAATTGCPYCADDDATETATQVNTDAFAACAGGLVAVEAGSQAKSCPVGACCAD